MSCTHVDQIQEVGRLTHRRIRRKQVFALAMAVKISCDDGDAGDEAQGLQTIFIHRIIIRFRIKTAERGDGRADDVHGRRVFGKGLDDADDALRQFPLRSEQAF